MRVWFSALHPRSLSLPLIPHFFIFLFVNHFYQKFEWTILYLFRLHISFNSSAIMLAKLPLSVHLCMSSVFPLHDLWRTLTILIADKWKTKLFSVSISSMFLVWCGTFNHFRLGILAVLGWFGRNQLNALKLWTSIILRSEKEAKRKRANRSHWVIA